MKHRDIFRNIYNLRNRKGVSFSIKTIALIVLGMMMVMLLYVSFENWFGSITSEFLENLAFSPE